MSNPQQSTQNELVIEEFLEGQPRAELWRDLRDTLQSRLDDALAARDAVPPYDSRFAGLDKRVKELKQQVRALAEEEAVTRFVEDSVRSSLARPPHPGSGGDEFDLDDESYA